MHNAEILLVEDDTLLARMLTSSLKRLGFQPSAVTTLAAARDYLGQREPVLAMLDSRLPDGDGIDLLSALREVCPTILMTAYGSVNAAVAAMKAGAAEYLLKPIDLDELEMTVHKVLQARELQRDFHFVKRQLTRKTRDSKLMVGASGAMERMHDIIESVAPTDVSVLIQGESGTGKELVAAELHQRSERAGRNFVAIDCCTLQEKLFESELFGHERGAFTGADRQKKGLIEGAEGGTLFLDEIGEISPAIQAKLLRVLETGQYRRLGSTKDLRADVRIVAATNRDLEAMSREGGFRRDLYFRLSTFVLALPPLRERRDDIPALVEHFIANHSFSRRVEKHFSRAALQGMAEYDWPGNVRELKNVVERAIILSGNQSIVGPEHLSFSTPAGGGMGVSLCFGGEPTLEEIERTYLTQLLKKYSGHRNKVALALGVSERNLYRMLKKHGVRE